MWRITKYQESSALSHLHTLSRAFFRHHSSSRSVSLPELLQTWQQFILVILLFTLPDFSYPDREQLQTIYSAYLQPVLQHSLGSQAAWASTGKTHQLAGSLVQLYEQVMNLPGYSFKFTSIYIVSWAANSMNEPRWNLLWMWGIPNPIRACSVSTPLCIFFFSFLFFFRLKPSSQWMTTATMCLHLVFSRNGFLACCDMTSLQVIKIKCTRINMDVLLWG